METRRKTDLPLKPNVLIVDDDAKNRFALQEILEELDCNIVEASSGEAALQTTLQMPLALILLDIQMPEMDGFEVAKLLKHHQETKDIPIIFITAYSKDEQHIQYGHKLGAVDYILKPFDPVVLLSKVSSYLNIYKHKSMLQTQLHDLNRTQTELTQSNSELKEISEHDPLTHLLNRKGFESLFDSAIDYASTDNKLLALMYIDLDNFKKVNDTFGHDVGDELLKIVALRFTKTLRTTELVSGNLFEANIGRMGGDEFLILLVNITDLQSVHTIAKRLLSAFTDQKFIINGYEINVSMSIGISIFPQDAKTPAMLSKHADEAMYAVKKSGKCDYQLYGDLPSD